MKKKPKTKHWLVTLNNGDYDIMGQVWANTVTQNPGSNIVTADGVDINFGLIVAAVEEVE